VISKTINGITVNLGVSVTWPNDDITIYHQVVKNDKIDSVRYISIDLEQVDVFIEELLEAAQQVRKLESDYNKHFTQKDSSDDD
jgi:hypothetical protein